MPDELKPKHYEGLQKRYPDFISAVEALARTTQQNGPLDAKTIHLVQLGAAAAMHSEGAVLSHARRAHAAGASPEAIRHALVALTTTIGFPTVAAALQWVEKHLEE